MKRREMYGERNQEELKLNENVMIDEGEDITYYRGVGAIGIGGWIHNSADAVINTAISAFEELGEFIGGGVGLIVGVTGIVAITAGTVIVFGFGIGWLLGHVILPPIERVTGIKLRKKFVNFCYKLRDSFVDNSRN